MRWEDRFGTDTGRVAKIENGSVGKDQPAANDADGWDQYRQWISKAPVPGTKRSGIDPSLYSWKGYRDWTDKVRRNWSKDPDDDQQ
ncbi:MAG: hypothetical protein KJP08_01860 [Gammaproteobacteria bacterium]|nr:hypothetical protein [Gammaproteobacteria bacterium]MBT8093529.1 hypothetical protein [Gammaproteobacteria bacterium]MBT8106507.1 hypothetical protein [Gammaproteobacteria bacterium]NNK26522.1 hypothetical protein [Woeseiaceae bacterium]NNL62564.1 hypothetical protein [Woeseiaceae bacterium]